MGTVAGRVVGLNTMMAGRLALAIPITLGALWPRNAVIVQRPPDDALDWLPRTLSWYDRSSAAPLPLAGALPIICHEAAVTLPALTPRRGELLWDVGAGAGSVAIEWMLTDPTMRAVAVEKRLERIGRRAAVDGRIGDRRRFGWPHLCLVTRWPLPAVHA